MMPDLRDRLTLRAREAALHAYAPYSRFRVGAAVMADNKIFAGCNVENASYGLTICAERVAAFNAIASGATKLSAIAIVCPEVAEEEVLTLKSPCGACRQVLSEFASDDFVFIIDGKEYPIGSLLPLAFKLKKP